MIVRILGEGQFEVHESELDRLNALDSELQEAVEAGDEARFRTALTTLLGHIHAAGDPVPVEIIEPSELVLPGPDSTLAEVHELLSDEGLIPG